MITSARELAKTKPTEREIIMFTSLKDLPAAKRELKKLGYTIKSANGYLNGRKAFNVTDAENRTITVSDYALLAWANS